MKDFLDKQQIENAVDVALEEYRDVYPYVMTKAARFVIKLNELGFIIVKQTKE